MGGGYFRPFLLSLNAGGAVPCFRFDIIDSYSFTMKCVVMHTLEMSFIRSLP